jgi:N-acetylmuramoyl-L-alanine amidase
MDTALLTPNQYSRPQRPLEQIKGIVVHWVENPGKSAEFNRNYFESLKDSQKHYASAHYVIDSNTIIQCIPENEMAYHVGADKYTDLAMDRFAPYPNAFLLGIELCHPTWTGAFEPDTIWQAALLCALLCHRHNLDPMIDILRHFDITGKVCPKYYVERPQEFTDFKVYVHACMERGEAGWT